MRIPTLTDEIQRRLCDALRAGDGSREIACEAVGISTSDLDAWLEQGERGEEPYAVLRQAVMVAEARAEMDLVRAVRANTDGRWQHYAWLLERRFPENWALEDGDMDLARRSPGSRSEPLSATSER